MTHQPIYIGGTPIAFSQKETKGELVNFDNEVYYKITNSDEMRPFFISLVSNSNHWMFIASNGGLTAGRKNADNALFPYYTDDKITESIEHTGSITIVKVIMSDKTLLWEPFSNKYKGLYRIERNLYKNEYGNKLIFEEHNLDLELSYRYEWNTSDKYGFVRKSTISNQSQKSQEISILDGLQNIIPYSVGEELQKASSNLVDAYKRNELVHKSGIGIYALSATIVDKAEPSEALSSNIVWSLGLSSPTYLVSSRQLDNFRNGQDVVQEEDVKAERGAYITTQTVTLKPGTSQNWMMIANTNQSISNITEIEKSITSSSNLKELVQEDIDKGTKELLKLANSADAMQLTADKLRNTRHFSNTLFNIMRGGIVDNNYQVEKWDFISYLSKANKEVHLNEQKLLSGLPETFTIFELHNHIATSKNVHLQRLCLEYLPLKFSRRHGDPSRPWNKFLINTKNDQDGSKVLDYEGNWRDIFQNWEALALSYPAFIESMIYKFLNATTFDGYNPYRVTKGGFDWETIEEDDPWSYIGYWGDHQIIYLQKFLEIIERYQPGKLVSLFNKNIFVYANVPYKIKDYNSILKNPKDTIDFDFKLNNKITDRKKQLGADGSLLLDNSGSIYNVNFIEKILATVLAKVANLIPEAGIWLNTQRPEWNDANNALVGNGASMVTLYYLRRFLSFFNNVLKDSPSTETLISEELHKFFMGVTSTLVNNESLLVDSLSDHSRKTILDGLGKAASIYRTQIYTQSHTGIKKALRLDEIKHLIKVTLSYIDHSIEANEREDGLYHAYNIVDVSHTDQISISYLDEMLEGQVAVLSSGYLQPQQSLAVLDSLNKSALYREDQQSYILYPNKELPKFLAKNHIPQQGVKESTLLQKLLDDGNHDIIEKDRNGNYHFNTTFNNANALSNALDKLTTEKYKDLIDLERTQILAIYENVFNHKAFTGRSGTFFGYEGLGSIYWHMVSKLALASQECVLQSISEGKDQVITSKLIAHYYEITEGIGVHKTPQHYGAFPTDPYSHTPGGKGAQQPGMTGQVKEDIISRFGELGITVTDGKLGFNPAILNKEEFLKQDALFNYTDVHATPQTITVSNNELSFTYCQVPVIYTISNETRIEVHYSNDKTQEFTSLELDNKTSTSIFHRTGEIEYLKIYLPQDVLL